MQLSKLKHLPRILNSILMLFLVSQLGLAQEGFNKKEQSRATTCQLIFNELKQVQGLSQYDKPILEMVVSLNPNNLKVALVNNLGIVQFDRASMNLCFKMEQDSLNAIAFVLSHELAHYMHQHVVVNKFLENQVGIESQGAVLRSDFNIQSVDSQQAVDSDQFSKDFDEALQNLKIRENEAQADLDAGFTSYLAGFETKNAGPEFFERAYERFDINSSSKKYVSLQERKEIMQYAGAKLDTLIQVFEVANYLTAIKEFELAEHCYQYVAKDYKNKVILNNLGVLQLRKYMSFVDEEYVKYALPITMELDFNSGSRGDENEIEQQFRRLQAPLVEAIHYFDKATLQSNSYALPYLNKSIAYFLLNELKNKFAHVAQLAADDLVFAKSAALQAKQIGIKAKNNDLDIALSQTYGMLAIIEYEMGSRSDNIDRSQIDALFNLGLLSYPENPIIRKNKKILFEGELLTFEPLDNSNEITCDLEETILGKKPNDPLVIPFTSFDFRIELANFYKDKTAFFFTASHIDDKRRYNVFKSSMVDGKINSISNRIGLVITASSNEKTACSIGKNSSFTDLQGSYGAPTDSISSSRGNLYYYKGENRAFGEDFVVNDGIIFNLDIEMKSSLKVGRVNKWCYIQKQILIE